ncbi:MAG: NfeD family protein [Acidimicrobiia bacterium]|nr:NfeD family protein [Acidimicrobiia bacterium]
MASLWKTVNSLYIVAAILGVPLVAYTVLAGDSDGDLGGDVDGEGPFAFLSLILLGFTLAFFGVGGLVYGALGLAEPWRALLALVTGATAGTIQSALFRLLRRSSASSDVADAELVGRRAQVVVPITAAGRGSVRFEVRGQRVQLTAEASSAETMTEPIEHGSSVVIVEIHRGVAIVARLDPELG